VALNGSVIEGDIVKYLEDSEENLFVTGKAGAGKSVQLRRYMSRNRHRSITLAPTGIAAINCDGETIHRAFSMGIESIVDDEKAIRDIARRASPAIKMAATLLIDEIGMVRTDLMDVLDQVLRIVKKCDKPFGGIRIIAFGDLYQLPPIVKHNEEEYFKEKYGTSRGYFFCLPMLKKCPFKVVELTKVFRQRDDRFITILNSARVGSVTTEQLALLNSRYRPDFKAADGFVTLCPRNSTADKINSDRLASLPGKSVDYFADYDEGFPKSSFPNGEVVTLKEGCQVMVIKNIRDDDDRLVPNGKIGTVSSLRSTSADVMIDGQEVTVGFEEWETHKTIVADGKISSSPVGCFRQIPLKVAYACTIHKSQGVTLDNVIINMEGGAFTDGQTYVALSRCRSLDGIILKCKLTKNDIRADSTLSKFMTWSQMNDNYIEFVQDTIPEVDGKVAVDENPMDIVKEGGRENAWVTEKEFAAMNDLLMDGNENECLDASRILLPRLADELRCLRTEIADMKSNMETLNVSE
jgi:ATP-dependent exoDNAse (exonuclease V) alpha subunit